MTNVADETDQPAAKLTDRDMVEIRKTLASIKTISETTGAKPIKILDAEMALQMIGYFDTKIRDLSRQISRFERKHAQMRQLSMVSQEERQHIADRDRLESLSDALEQLSAQVK
jgi:hypothetical protein